MSFTGPVLRQNEGMVMYQMICRCRYYVLHRKKRTVPYGNYNNQTSTGSVPYWNFLCCGYGLFVRLLPIVFPDPTFFRNFLLCCWFLIKFLTKFFTESVKLQPYCWDQQQKITPDPQYTQYQVLFLSWNVKQRNYFPSLIIGICYGRFYLYGEPEMTIRDFQAWSRSLYPEMSSQEEPSCANPGLLHCIDTGLRTYTGTHQYTHNYRYIVESISTTIIDKGIS